MEIVLGTRVVRGPNWKWGDQDHGEGHVGTVVYIGKGDLADRPEKTVIVMWDMGRKNNYRAGFNRCFDLRIFDNAQTGVLHPDVTCIVCGEEGIRGIRWKCFNCFNCNLCMPCFMYGKHEISHQFQRFRTKDSAGTALFCRQGARMVEALGTFPGATVQRGNDWKYGDQDGGDSSRPGNMLIVQGWGDKANRAGAGVKWPSNSKLYRYRLGIEGKVDIKCVKEARGGVYYPDLLPNLGEVQDLYVGDTVVIELSKDTLKSLDVARINVTRETEEVAGEKGVVKGVTHQGELSVQFIGGQTVQINPIAVQKVSAFSVGDQVQIIRDQSQAESLQKGHGGWNPSMRKILGREAKVEKVYSDGDVKVKIDDTSVRLLFHPACLTLVESGQHEAMFEQEPEDGFQSLLDQRQSSLTVQSDQSDKRRLSKAAAMGRVSEVKDILEAHPDWIDSVYSNRTALQVAAHQGHLPTVKELMKYKPSLEETDNDGDTALLYAVYGNKPAVVEYLLDKGSYINIINKQRRSCLHVAARRGHVKCVKILLNKGCQCNMQDKAGDLALHDAIHKDKRDVIDVLVPWRDSDLTIRNNKSLSVLHYAALRGNAHATECLVSHAPHLLKMRKDDGQTALHVAASNNFEKVARCLIEKDKSILDDRDSLRKTPLLIAVSGGHVNIVTLLVEAGADVNASDADGDTCLHIAVLRFKHNPSGNDTEVLQPFCKGAADSLLKIPGVALMVYLIQKGARVDVYNRSQRTPLQLMEKQSLAKVLSSMAKNQVRMPASVDEVDCAVPDSASRVFNLKSENNRQPIQSKPLQPQQQVQQQQQGVAGRQLQKQHQQRRVSAQPCLPSKSPQQYVQEALPRQFSNIGFNSAFEGVHRIDIKELEMGIEIGGGSFAKVYRGRWRGTTVAIKKMNMAGSNHTDVEREVDIHKQAMHPNIVQLMALGYSDVSAYLVMTFIHGSTLHQSIFPGEQTNSCNLTIAQKNLIAKDVLSALTFMHASGLLHLDIKPSNILLEKGTFKTYLCDLGLSYIKQRAHMSLSSHINAARGTPMYMAPEMHDSGSCKVCGAQDVWSIAATFIELYGEIPVYPSTMTVWGLAKLFMAGRIIPESLKEVKMPHKDILKPCFTADPKARPSASDLLLQFEALCEES